MEIKIVDYLPDVSLDCVGIDIETTATPDDKMSNPWQSRIVSIGLSCPDKVWIIPPSGNFESVVPLLNNPDIKKIGHNLQFDLSFLIHQFGAKPQNLYDTMLASRLIYAGDEGRRHNLADVMAMELGVMLDKQTREEFQQHSGELSAKQVTYIANDVQHLITLREKQVEKISKFGLGRVMNLENHALLPVTEMYLTGVRFDRSLWEKHLVEISTKLSSLEERLAEICNLPFQTDFEGNKQIVGFNPRSWQQKLKLLEKKGIKLPNTRQETLEQYLEKYPHHELVRIFLDYSIWSKMRGWDYPKYINPADNLIHANWNQLEAQTGRFSSSNPNMQNVPRPQPDKPNFRQLFLPPDPEMVFIVADYSQQEVRILAEITGDKRLREACMTGDVYSAMAEMAFGHSVEKGSEERYSIKTSVLAAVYGAGAPRLAGLLKTSESNAERLISIIFTTFPGIKQYTNHQTNMAIQRGFVTTLLGRRRNFVLSKEQNQRDEAAPFEYGITKEKLQYYRRQREATNAPIQGTAADMGKRALWLLDEQQNMNDNFRFTLYVHDELVVSARQEDAEEVLYQVIGAMEQAGRDLCPNVAMPVEATISPLWEK